MIDARSAAGTHWNLGFMPSVRIFTTELGHVTPIPPQNMVEMCVTERSCKNKNFPARIDFTLQPFIILTETRHAKRKALNLHSALLN
jgi:hypothetical protein